MVVRICKLLTGQEIYCARLPYYKKELKDLLYHESQRRLFKPEFMSFHPSDTNKRFLFVAIGNFIVRVDLHTSSHVVDNILLSGFFAISKNDKSYQEVV